jgi:hypothetical protein
MCTSIQIHTDTLNQNHGHPTISPSLYHPHPSHRLSRTTRDRPPKELLLSLVRVHPRTTFAVYHLRHTHTNPFHHSPSIPQSISPTLACYPYPSASLFVISSPSALHRIPEPGTYLATYLPTQLPHGSHGTRVVYVVKVSKWVSGYAHSAYSSFHVFALNLMQGGRMLHGAGNRETGGCR